MTSTDAPTDFYELRRDGIGRIEAASSALWTDYNVHDPGITILEGLSYAITELAHLTGLPIADLVASSLAGPDALDDQTFHSPRTILTVNPTTPDDLRRRLIDVDSVRNAWVQCKECACDAPYFAWCDDDRLALSHDPAERPDHVTEFVRVEPRGLVDLLVELESDPDLGDLNDRTIVRRRTLVDGEGRRHVVTVEARFPDWPLARLDERHRLATDAGDLGITLRGPNRTKSGTTPVDDAELRAHWFDVFYVDVDIELSDATVITLDDVAVRLFGDAAVRDETTVDTLRTWLGDTTVGGFVGPYRSKLGRVDSALDAARGAYHAHRNLDEDLCRIEQVGIVDIAVCADVEVEPAADIEAVQAQIWFEVDRHLDPPIDFRSLAELLADGEPVESIFDGPALDHGFITGESLAASGLRPDIRVSDLLDLLVDIPGVVSVERLQLTAYGADGQAIPGISDPVWAGGSRVFDPARTSATWLMYLPARHRPRLHRRLSRFLFESNGLPFLPRVTEAEDTLVQLHAQAARPKLRAADLDLPMPLGRTRDLTTYHPVQHDFPQVYGIGPAGLPSTASAARRAQASQLKGYLLVFEQLLRNAREQLARLGDLFSLDGAVDHTYFSAPLSAAEVVGYDDLVPALDAVTLASLVETDAEFVDRRNRFLDHLLARFGESFREFSLVLASVQGSRTARSDIIAAKLAFLRDLPELGRDRGRAFDRTAGDCDPGNRSGLERRIALLLGLPDVSFRYTASSDDAPPGFTHRIDLDASERLVLTPPEDVATAIEALIVEHGLAAVAPWTLTSDDEGVRVVTNVPTDEPEEETVQVEEWLDEHSAAGVFASELATVHRSVLASLTRRDRLAISAIGGGEVPDGWTVSTADDVEPSGSIDRVFPTESAALAAADRVSAAAAHARSIVVEHLLLRPKFPGDALYPACSDSGCCTCGDEDPYSFRLTYVAPGWTAPLNSDTRLRSFADRTVREQTPAHLLAKVCWVGNDGYVADPCDPLVDELAGVLAAETDDHDSACACASEIAERVGDAFGAWLDDHAVSHLPASVIHEAVVALLTDEVDVSDVVCADVIDEAVHATLIAAAVDRFVELARGGYQFERFADAWCNWLAADADIDWDAERLQETITEILGDALVAPAEADHATLCGCAATILARFGSAFRAWMLENLAAGRTPDGFTPFVAPAIEPCPGLTFDPVALTDLRLVLAARYDRYVEVSYRLQVVVDALADLRNTHPRATLHDCDEGSDFNPVRLGQTALGRN